MNGTPNRSFYAQEAKDAVIDRDLARLCESALKLNLNVESGLYDRQIRDARFQPTIGDETLTSTCICLIGADRYGLDGYDLAAAPERTLDAAIACMRRRRYKGGIGLLLWANAVLDGDHSDLLLARSGISIPDPRVFISRLTTMETAWLLSGLLHELARCGSDLTRFLAQAALSGLQARFNAATRLMRHSDEASPSLPHRVRMNIPNFADQIYSVQAFAFAAQILGDRTALKHAAEVATRLVELQGPLGQWWWHYDAASGQVAEPYPVYSVHQHSMAPMAFLALRGAGGPDFGPAIESGFQWIRRTELSTSMVDREHGTIWRDLSRDEGPIRSRLRKARMLSGRPLRGPTPLRLNRETRPYEWGWFIYAQSIAGGLPKGRHLA